MKSPIDLYDPDRKGLSWRDWLLSLPFERFISKPKDRPKLEPVIEKPEFGKRTA